VLTNELRNNQAVQDRLRKVSIMIYCRVDFQLRHILVVSWSLLCGALRLGLCVKSNSHELISHAEAQRRKEKPQSETLHTFCLIPILKSRVRDRLFSASVLTVTLRHEERRNSWVSEVSNRSRCCRWANL